MTPATSPTSPISPTPVTPIDADPADVADRLGAATVSLPPAVLDRLAATGAEIEDRRRSAGRGRA